jgi:hypothetical protein
MKTFTILALSALLTGPLILAQEDARDIAREMGADTTTSISAGTDRNGLHRDTERVEQPQQHVPNLLDSAEGSKTKKSDSAATEKLIRDRDQLLKERQAKSDTAAATAVAAMKSKQAAGEVGVLSDQSNRAAIAEATARRQAERDWDAKNAKNLRRIDRLLKKSSEDDTLVRFHAPSLVNPK